MKPSLYLCLILHGSCGGSNDIHGPLHEPPETTSSSASPRTERFNPNAEVIALDDAELPSIAIIGVSPNRVEYEVRNSTPRPYFYWGWSGGSTLATSEVLRNDQWETSFITMCGTGSGVYTLGPGQMFRTTLPNYNEGDVRVLLALREMEGDLAWEEPNWFEIQSEQHAGWKANPTMQTDRPSADR